MDETFAERPKEGEPWDVVIIGSGPSALTAAIYTVRGAASTLILGGAKWGGQLMLTTEVDNFPGFPEGIQGPVLMENMRKQAERFGSLIVNEDVASVRFDEGTKELTTEGATYKAKAVIIATGAETRWLGVPGEDKLRGRGVSSCAPCDAPFFKDKEVAVIGGGDAAMEEALVLTKYSPKVTMIHRRETFKASQAMQQRVLNNDKINVIWDTETLEMNGENIIESLKLKTKADSEQGKKILGDGMAEYGGKVLVQNDGFVEWSLPTQGVFVAIGHVPSTNIFKDKVGLDVKGYVERVLNADSEKPDGFRMRTSVDGVFVAGDVHDYHYRQAITAAAYGCMAGMEALRYLDKGVQSW